MWLASLPAQSYVRDRSPPEYQQQPTSAADQPVGGAGLARTRDPHTASASSGREARRHALPRTVRGHWPDWISSTGSRDRTGQAAGYHLAHQFVEIYGHVAPEVERLLFGGLERRWKQAHVPRRERQPAEANTAPT